MTISRLPLSYCTNVHPARTLADVYAGLDKFSVPIREATGSPLAVGLWLAKSVIDELQTATAREQLAQFLTARQLACYTLNSFPYGDFHSERVKEQVYLPDWTTEFRRTYTLDCARVLSALLPPGQDGSLSTVPLGFKALAENPDFVDLCCDQLITTALELADLAQETGRNIRLAIEPEPLCVLETTPETLEFFQLLRAQAAERGALDAVTEYLGVCYDICHQAVEFEDVAASISALDQANIRINKVHISCAIEARGVSERPEVRAELARFIEPRYLHQTFAGSQGQVLGRHVDLSTDILERPPAEFSAAEFWRVHFHVPVDAVQLGLLGTTRGDIERALPAIAALPYAPHLELETYTWEVLPDGGRRHVVDGIVRELLATQGLLAPFSPEK